MNRYPLTLGVVGVIGVLLLAGCSTYRQSAGASAVERDELHTRTEHVLAQFMERDPTLQTFFDNAYGYVIFPSVSKGGAGLGAARGRGEVYEQGELVGYANLTQVTLGAQLGGQTFSELIFFQDRTTMEEFKRGNVEFSGQASAVAASRGAAGAADFDRGVAIFVMPQSGLMFEASVGGQKFSFTPLQGPAADDDIERARAW